jgi:RNA polymerase sigma-70 factor (ECF subfamily)
MEDFTAIIEREGAYLRRLCAHLLVATGDADDAAQDALLNAWRARAKMPHDPTEQRRWLTVIARNGCYSRNRHEQVRTRWLATKRVGVSPDTAHEATVWAALREADAAIGTLGAMDRRALALSVGLRPREMGAVMGCTATAAKLRVFRARQHLVKRIGQRPPVEAGGL